MAARIICVEFVSFYSGLFAIKCEQPRRAIFVVPILGLFYYVVSHTHGALPVNTWIPVDMFVWFAIFAVEHIINLLFIVRYRPSDGSWQTADYWLRNPRFLRSEKSTEQTRKWRIQRKPDLAQNSYLRRADQYRFAWGRLLSLLRKVIIMVTYYEIIDLPWLLQLNKSDFLTSKRSFLRRLILMSPDFDLSREVVVRVWAVCAWFFEDYMYISGLHDTIAILFVGILGIDEPTDWPPMFGSLRYVTSLRTWYSQFWHHLLYRCGVDYAKRVLGCLGVDTKKRTKTTRWLVGAFVFLLSAANHLLCTWTLSRKVDWRTAAWWASQPIFLAVEELFQLMLNTYVPEARQLHTSIFDWGGCCWTFAVFFWGIPKFQYVSKSP